MADYVSPEQRRRIAGGLMAAQYAENPPSAPMGYDWNAAPLSPGLMNFAAQRGQPGVIQKTLGLIPGFDQDGKRAAQSWGNALMSTAQFPIDAVAGMGQALTAPARAYRGEFDPVSEEGVGEALNVAGNAMLGGFAAPKPAGVVGSAGGSLKAFPDGIKREWAPGGERVEIYTPETKPYPMGGNKFPDRTGFTDEPLAPAFDLKPRSDGSGEWVWPFTEADEALTKRYGSRAAPDLYANGGRSGAATGAALGAIPDTPVVTGYRGSAYSGKVDGPAFWASSDPTLAGDYAKAHAKEARGRGSSGENITPAEFKFNNPMNIDASGETWANIPFRGNRELSDNIARIARDEGFDGLVINNLRDGVDSSASSAPQTTIAALQRGTVYSPLTGDLLYANGGRSGAATGAALGAIPDTRPLSPQGMSRQAALDALSLRAYERSIENAVPRTTTGVSLSQNMSQRPDRFQYAIFNNGQPVGHSTGSVRGDTANISWIGHPTDGANSIGMSGLKALREQIRSDYPDAKVFTGTRTSGARAGDAAAPGNNRNQTVYLAANGGRPGAATGAALGAIPDTPGIRATNISDISTAGPLPNRILAYHGAASKFDNLDLARAPDVGLHYGTLDVTDQFSGFRDYGDKRGVRAPDNSRIYPVILDGSRMARAADGALFDETAQAHSFLDAVKKGKIEGVTNATPGFADLERNMSALPYGDASANPIVRDWLTSNGLDGVIYPNTYDGSGVSAMMWKNVRSALGNNDLLYANGGRGGAATGAALGAPQSMNDPALAEILRKYGLDLPSRPASPQYRPGDA